MLHLDHITVIAPTLGKGVAHVRNCLDLDIPFGTRHSYMGTHNHRLQLGNRTYLEIVALDPDGINPGRARWFGVDNRQKVRADWEAGRRLRGWVANTEQMGEVLARYPQVFGEEVPLPPESEEFAFSIPRDGSLPLNGAAPSLIDHRGDPTSMNDIPDLGARLKTLTLIHPDPQAVLSLYNDLNINGAPSVIKGPDLRYVARVETPNGVKELT